MVPSGATKGRWGREWGSGGSVHSRVWRLKERWQEEPNWWSSLKKSLSVSGCVRFCFLPFPLDSFLPRSWNTFLSFFRVKAEKHHRCSRISQWILYFKLHINSELPFGLWEWYCSVSGVTTLFTNINWPALCLSSEDQLRSILKRLSS